MIDTEQGLACVGGSVGDASEHPAPWPKGSAYDLGVDRADADKLFAWTGRLLRCESSGGWKDVRFIERPRARPAIEDPHPTTHSR